MNNLPSIQDLIDIRLKNQTALMFDFELREAIKNPVGPRYISMLKIRQSQEDYEMLKHFGEVI